MNSRSSTVPKWEHLRNKESRMVEELLRKQFQEADAYRYNSASLRVRVVDDKFKGLSNEKRDDLVEPILSKLDESTQADIMNLVLLYPGEEREVFLANINNEEFEHYTKSML